jgi:hypothetical protein
MAQTLKFGKGTWATKTGSSMAYNDQSGNYKPLPFNVERDSIATRVNKEGLIEVVGKDKLRIDYTDSAKGVALLENSSTNFITYSQDFTSSEWVLFGFASGDAPILTSNYATSPDGKQNATRLQFNLNGGTTTTDRSYIRYDSFASQTDYYYSCYVKSANGQEQKLLWQHGGDDSEFTVTNEWQRVELDRNGNAETFAGFSLRGGISTVDSADVLIWGFQVERNSFATSYIPTSGSTVQRQADVVNGSGNSEVFNDSEGVLFADIAYLETQPSPNSRVAISDGTTANRLLIQNVNSTANRLQFYVIVSSSTQADFYTNLSDIKLFNKIAFKYKSNDFSVWINGFEVLTDTSGNTFSNGTISELNFDGGDGNNDFYGKTKEIGYYDAVLTDSELEYLTSYRSLNELVTELNLNTL